MGQDHGFKHFEQESALLFGGQGHGGADTQALWEIQAEAAQERAADYALTDADPHFLLSIEEGERTVTIPTPPRGMVVDLVLVRALDGALS